MDWFDYGVVPEVKVGVLDQDILCRLGKLRKFEFML